MVIFTILMVILAALVAAGILTAFTGSVAFVVVFGDLIIFILIVRGIAKLFGRRK